MRTVFVDTVYWIAIVRPKDPWQDAAVSARKGLGTVHLVTTDEVLTEFLAALSRGSSHLRQGGVKAVHEILSDRNTHVVPQSRESFRKGLTRYEARNDKKYSLQDCISMNVMDALSITEILTNDHHFEQEGFVALMKNDTL